MNFLGIKQVVAINSILKINFLYHLFIFFTELWAARKIKPNTRGLRERFPQTQSTFTQYCGLISPNPRDSFAVYRPNGYRALRAVGSAAEGTD